MITSAINDYKNEVGSIKTIAKKYGISSQRLRSELILRGIEIRGYSSTTNKVDTNEILKLHGLGKSIRDISMILGISDRMMISSIIKKQGCDVSKRTYNLDETVFDVIDTEHKAYWLGFMYADGCVTKGHTVQLKLNVKDRNHIEKFKDFLKYDGKTYCRGCDNSCKVDITSKKLHDALARLGCSENKTFSLRFPTEDIVPKHLIYHFIRGFFDGDGCISLDKSKTPSVLFNVVGTLSMMEGIRDLLLPTSNISKSGNIYDLRCKGNIKSFKVLNTLYQDATISLDRKLELYKLYKSQYFNAV